MDIRLIRDPTYLAAQMPDVVFVVKLAADRFRMVTK
jgi:hypothetical protein